MGEPSCSSREEFLTRPFVVPVIRHDRAPPLHLFKSLIELRNQVALGSLHAYALGLRCCVRYQVYIQNLQKPSQEPDFTTRSLPACLPIPKIHYLQYQVKNLLTSQRVEGRVIFASSVGTLPKIQSLRGLPVRSAFQSPFSRTACPNEPDQELWKSLVFTE